MLGDFLANSARAGVLYQIEKKKWSVVPVYNDNQTKRGDLSTIISLGKVSFLFHTKRKGEKNYPIWGGLMCPADSCAKDWFRDQGTKMLRILLFVVTISNWATLCILQYRMRRLMQRDCSDSGNKERGMLRTSRGMKELHMPVRFGRAPSRCQVSEPALWCSEALAQKPREQG